jgi:hypothetical protein
MDADGLFGHVNDSIRKLATEGPGSDAWEFLCECPDVECHAMVSLTLLEFDQRRAASPPLPVLSSHHDGHNGRPVEESDPQVLATNLNGHGSVDGS